MQSKITLVCFAVKEEAAVFQRLLKGRPEIQVLLTGMGRRKAAAGLNQALSGDAPGLVLSAGFAGGLNPQFASGTVLFSADPETNLDPQLRAAGAFSARFHCSDRVAITSAEKRELRAGTGADAVEMESQAIRELCRKRGIPSATVRVILDPAGDDLPLDFNAMMTEDQRLDGSKFALRLLKSPWVIGRLLRFRKQVRSAAHRLAGVLHQVLKVGQS